MKGHFMKNLKEKKLRKKFLMQKSTIKKLNKVSKAQNLSKNKILLLSVKLFKDSFLKSDLFADEILEGKNDKKRF